MANNRSNQDGKQRSVKLGKELDKKLEAYIQKKGITINAGIVEAVKFLLEIEEKETAGIKIYAGKKSEKENRGELFEIRRLS